MVGDGERCVDGLGFLIGEVIRWEVEKGEWKMGCWLLQMDIWQANSELSFAEGKRMAWCKELGRREFQVDEAGSGGLGQLEAVPQRNDL